MGSAPAHRYKQSGVIPYRRKKGRIEILLVSNRRRSRWVIPKGMVAKGLDERTSATKEALEEAGVLGKVSKNRVGRFKYDKWGGICRVTVFLMEVHTMLDQWPEQDRKRRWVGLVKARKLVDEKELGKLISKVPHIIASEKIRLKKVSGYK